MKQGDIVFLKAVVVLAGIGALAFLLGMPQIEGRNAHATQFQIYFQDPFLAYAYVAAVPFFAALVQAFRLLGHARLGTLFSVAAVRAARLLKLCGLAMIGFVLGGEILLFANLFGTIDPTDDRAGGVMMGVLIGLGSAIIAATGSVAERILREGAAGPA